MGVVHPNGGVGYTIQNNNKTNKVLFLPCVCYVGYTIQNNNKTNSDVCDEETARVGYTIQNNNKTNCLFLSLSISMF